ncbi:hypothetical protein [Capnocytophaga leadbetteri]|uniref:hypothetical protein n=1 Tax=Capnocytophaga leadbetteri TaxID=327575 RepID=UPI0028E8ADFC|nr:hypothetical protein [Capnocytophaga leadbetteri]
MKKYLYLLLVLLGACSYEDTPPEQALYCWKTQVQFSAEEADFVKNNRIERLYIRYCDVGLRDNAPVPIAPVDIDTLSVQGKTVIPVVYLKNEIFNSELTEGNSTYIGTLAHKLGDYIEQINRYYRLRVSEVQFDCDWSLSTKQAYFSMLEAFKKEFPYQLSATIRLHQVKYREETGVPPVDYGVLMYYNMGRITATGANSIYDRSTALRYLGKLRAYPLPLDIALPMFAWGVHSADGQVLNLVGGLTHAEAQAISTLVRIDASDIYKVAEQTYYKGRVWQVGDLIKIEEVSDAQRKEMLADLREHSSQSIRRVIWFVGANLSE